MFDEENLISLAIFLSFCLSVHNTYVFLFMLNSIDVHRLINLKPFMIFDVQIHVHKLT